MRRMSPLLTRHLHCKSRTFADAIEAMMPRVRITELLHEVNRETGSCPPPPICAQTLRELSSSRAAFLEFD